MKKITTRSLIIALVVFFIALLPIASFAGTLKTKKFSSDGTAALHADDPDCTTVCSYTLDGTGRTHASGKPLTGPLRGSVTVVHLSDCDYVIAALEIYSEDSKEAMTVQGIDSCANQAGSNEEYYDLTGGTGRFSTTNGSGKFQVTTADGQFSYTADGIVY